VDIALSARPSILDLESVHRGLPIGRRGKAVSPRSLKPSMAGELGYQDEVVA